MATIAAALEVKVKRRAIGLGVVTLTIGILVAAAAMGSSVYANVQPDAERLEHILETSGPDSYQKAREALLASLVAKFPNTYPGWMQTIEAKARTQYVLAVLAKGFLLGTKSPAAQMYIQLLLATINHSISLNELDGLYYAGPIPSHGLYIHDNHEIRFNLLPPDELYPVLIHELSHFFDPVLQYARGPYLNDYVTIDRLLEKPLTKWSEQEKEFFGRYYFVKMLYLPAELKEIEPRLNACVDFTQLRKAGGLRHAGRDDLQTYRDVLSGRIDCREWVVRNYEQTARAYGVKFQYYWNGQPQFIALEQAAFDRWRESLGLRKFNVPFAYSMPAVPPDTTAR